MAEKMVIKDRMELPQDPEAVFGLVTDLDAVAPCVPGARLDPADPDLGPDAPRSGEVVMAFGPIRYRYKGTIRITSLDAAARTVNYEAAAAETSGEGTLAVEMAIRVSAGDSGGSVLTVQSDTELTGMIADYGQGMAEEVAKDIIGQFVKAVRGRDLGPASTAGSAGSAGATGSDGVGPSAARVVAPSVAPPIGGFRLIVRATFRRLVRKFRRSRPAAGSNGD